MARARDLGFRDLARRVGMQAHAAFRQHGGDRFGVAHQLRQIVRQAPKRGDAFAQSRSRASGPICSIIQRSTTGRAASQMSKSGSRPRATPSTTTMVFCSSTSCGWACMSKRRVVSNNCSSSRAIETSRALRPKIGSPMARNAWAKVSTG